MSQPNGLILQMEKPNRSSLRPPRDVGQSQDRELGFLAPQARYGTTIKLKRKPLGLSPAFALCGTGQAAKTRAGQPGRRRWALSANLSSKSSECPRGRTPPTQIRVSLSPRQTTQESLGVWRSHRHPHEICSVLNPLGWGAGGFL